MPSRNPLTGKRLSGPEQQRLKASRCVSWKRPAAGQEQQVTADSPVTASTSQGISEAPATVAPSEPQTTESWDSFVPAPSTRSVTKRAPRSGAAPLSAEAKSDASVSHATLPPLPHRAKPERLSTVRTLAPPAPALVELPVPTSFAGLKPPPQGVSEIESWAAGLNLRAAAAAEEADEHSGPRVEAVIVLCRELGRLSVKASRSEKAVRLRKLRLNESGDIDLSSPPFDDPVASVAWAYYRLAQLAHEAAVSAKWFPDPRQIAVARALAGAGFLPCNDALAAVADRVRSQG